MKTKKFISLFLIAMFAVLTGGLITQQGGMPQMPPNFQMPSPEEMKKMMEQSAKTMVDQVFPQGDEDGDGKLSLDEYKKMYDIVMGQMPAGLVEEETEEEKEKRLKEEYEEIDADDDDSVTKEELLASILANFSGEGEEEEDSEDSEDSENEDAADEEESDEEVESEAEGG